MALKLQKIKPLDGGVLKGNIIAFWIMFIFLFSFGVVILESVFDNARDLELEDANGSRDILADNGSIQTLEGTIQSLTGITSNSSWLEFDGINDLVQIDFDQSLNFTLTQNFTISVWSYVNHNSTSDADISGVIHRSNDFIVRYNTGEKIFAFVYNNSETPLSASSTINYELFRWYNILITFEEGNLSLWIDGVFQDSVAEITNYSSRGVVTQIGNHNSRFMKGGIDEIRIYNRTLKSEDITEIHNSGRTSNSSLNSTGLVAWYSFNEGSGSILHDKSGNGNDGV